MSPRPGPDAAALADRTALVTGASRGIGRATALALARAGARVAAVGRSAGPLEELGRKNGIEPIVASIDTAEGCARVAGEASRRAGAIEILSTTPDAAAGTIAPSGRRIAKAGTPRWPSTSTHRSS